MMNNITWLITQIMNNITWLMLPVLAHEPLEKSLFEKM
jgi:hypothetical protein